MILLTFSLHPSRRLNVYSLFTSEVFSHFPFSALPLCLYFLYSPKVSEKVDLTHPGDKQLYDTYDLCQTLGSGSFGVVRLGIRKSDGLKVAIKILPRKKLISSKDSNEPDPLDKESLIMKMVDHPNIVKVFDSIQGSVSRYIIME